MASPEAPRPTSDDREAPWIARVRQLGQRTLLLILATVVVMWAHEVFFVEPRERQVGKLGVLLFLIPLAVLTSLALLVAWLAGKRNPRRE